MEKPSLPPWAELELVHQVCWLGLLASAFHLLVMFCWSANGGLGLGLPLATALTGGALVLFLGVWRILHGRQQRGLEEGAASHLAARDRERFCRMRSFMRTLAGFALPSLAFDGAALLSARGPLSAFAFTLFMAQRLSLALALALAWSALRGARRVQADAFAVSHPGMRVEVKLGLSMAVFVSTLLWNMGPVVSMAEAVHASDDLVLLGMRALGMMALGVMAWAAWIAYRVIWSRSRALGRGRSGTWSSELVSLLSFSLPGCAFFLGHLACLFAFSGKRLLEGTGLLLLAVHLLLGVVLLWAAGKVSLLLPSERPRERPSLPLALLSLLVIETLAGGFLRVALLGAFVAGVSEPSPSLASAMMVLAFLAASLGAGLLAHRLAAPARTGGPPRRPLLENQAQARQG